MERAIGYWLKHLNRLIEEAFGDALEEQALSRRHWQAMNTLAGAPLDERGWLRRYAHSGTRVR